MKKHLAPRVARAIVAAVGLLAARQSAIAQTPPARDTGGHIMPARGDSVVIHFVDVDLRAAIAALAPYFDRPLSFGAVPAVRVTFETPQPVPRSEIPRLARGLVESQNLVLIVDSVANMYRLEPKPPPLPAAPVTPTASIEGTQPTSPQFFVVHLHHARAADVAATVNALYGRASALGESGLRSGTLSQQMTANQLPPAGPPSTAASGQAQSQAAVFSGETSIVPDAGTNSLFIRANRTDFDLITQVVRELDVRPLQVLIEVIIAEIDRNSSFALGVDAATKKVTSKGDTGAAALSSGLGGGDFVGRIMHIGNPAIAAQLTIASARGEARILSRPVVLASNNDQAEILVGSQQPFIQVSQTQVGAVAQNQVVQYQPVGTRLLVRPTVSGDGYVTLDLTQEVNQATTQVVFNAPVISTRTIRTRLLVRDSQTVVLGGLSDRERDKTSGGIPILSSIPLIGGLFGHTTRSVSESEFFLFLTPRIIATDADARQATDSLQRATQADAP